VKHEQENSEPFHISAVACLPLVATEGGQNPPPQELGAIQGTVTRTGTVDGVYELEMKNRLFRLTSSTTHEIVVDIKALRRQERKLRIPS
jgi:hypothetical protein